eukprot:Ihof_evm5s74 gene=Ihof_evmTU5s74
MTDSIKALVDLVISQKCMTSESTFLALTDLVKEDESLGVEAFNLGLGGPLLEILKDGRNLPIMTSVTAVIAELAKNEECRTCIVSAGCFLALIEIVKEGGLSPNAVCALRAIANCCYDNEAHRTVLEQADGIKAVVGFVQAAASNKEASEMVRRVAAGAVINVVNDNEGLQKEAVRLGVIGGLLGLVNHNVAVDVMVIRAFNVLADLQEAREAMCQEGVISLLKDWVKRDEEDVQDIAMELLVNLVDTEDMAQLALQANGGVLQLVNDVKIGVNEKYRQLAAKIVSLVLSNDDCLDLEMENGTPLLESLAGWVNHTDSMIRMAAALAYGNIARSDERVGLLMSQGVASLLIGLLDATDVRELHAALGALKNMSIARSYRDQLVSEGLLQGIIKVQGNPQTPIHYLLASILKSLCSDNDHVSMQVVHQSELMTLLSKLGTDDDEGVWSEAGRTIAAIIRSTKTHRNKVTQKVNEVDGVRLLVHLLSSKHALVQNEGLIALALMAVHKGQPELIAASKGFDTAITALLTTCPTNEIKENALTLLETVLKS